MSELSTADLEQVYDRLAEAIDQAEGHSELMLVKLALLMARELGQRERVEALIGDALRDLAPA
ncbi:DUF2783 domain-containing protein [Ideonella sp. 4Y16]|uniref:DUF2783 domain-containing protein n=1 Tax=Ideonella alba TaxID=2824118 RepID=A0A940YIW4_9BURK|nr:DUF2783 domain-containing protein [Ideonella alba]MBQ0933222.1 DUF2783 domain-containing protein [Ideonella alba]MBQ0944693.1 DUF2783 domain-containing protein [Ideonella alba]